jgi:hypothetical protein
MRVRSPVDGSRSRVRDSKRSRKKLGGSNEYAAVLFFILRLNSPWAVTQLSIKEKQMKREVMNVAPVNAVPLEGKAAACTSSGGQQLIPAIAAVIITVTIVNP